MKDRGLSDQEIEDRLERMQKGEGGPPGGGASGLPPMMVERIRSASPEELENIKARMRQFGMSDERIDEIIRRVRSTEGSTQ
jgi:hypothetical protein